MAVQEKRRPIRKDEIRDWMSMIHVLFIDGLSMSAELSLARIAFHGGTNLHLSWNSPRFSEDLDFLVSKDFARRIGAAMSKIETRMQQVIANHDPGFRIEIRDKTRDPDRMLDHRIVMTREGVIGQAMVKAEFWQVEAGYFKEYDSKFLIQKPGVSMPDGPLVALSTPIPAASLQASFADKVAALGLRQHLKWRDLFDLWWLDAQIGTDVARHVEAVRHHASCYRDVSLNDGFERFLARDPEEILAEADPDLKTWLPTMLWDGLWPDEVRNMVDHAMDIARRFSDALDERPEDDGAGMTREKDDDTDLRL